MTTKGPSRKQIIIPMSNDNIIKFIKNSSLHIANINWSLKKAKSKVLVNFIYSDMACVIVITNKVTAQSDLYIIKNYIKKVDNIDTINVEALWLPQSKSYLKVIGIPYYSHDSPNKHLTLNDVEGIIKQNQIFDNIVLVSKLRVIKVSPKFDMSIIWIDIWDIQSSSKAKSLINRCFNIGRFIATIWGANMNPDVPQCKNCWWWGHTTISCHIQSSRCIKCSGPYKTENYHQYGWCCKANEKTNPPHLKMKVGALCPHSFKCSNCHRDHQVNSKLMSILEA